MMLYGSAAEDGAYLEAASGEAWAEFARIIYVAHGGQHPPAAEIPAP